MNKSVNTVWIDMTDLLSWRGNLTGIQRVTYEYAQRFSKDGLAKFFAHDRLANRLFEVDLDYISSVISKARETSVKATPIHLKVIKKLRGATLVLPKPVRKVTKKVLLKTKDYIFCGLSVSKVVRGPYSNFPEAKIRAGDKVYFIGAGWNNPKCFDEVVRLKKKHDFSLIVHINDILPIYQPQLFADELPKVFRPFIDKVIQNAELITVISEATKRDLKEYCRENNVEKSKILVVRLGDDAHSSLSVRPLGVQAKSKYILALGTFEIRKNYILIYQLLKLAQIENVDIPNFVIVGRKGWLTDDLARLITKDPHVSTKITWLNNASDEEVSWLFKNCLFSVFPSLCEGWGLPIVESLNHGKFCLSSGLSSMLEVGDGLIDYFLPYDPRECLNKILYYLSENRYQIANTKIKERYVPFTWDESYKDLLSKLSVYIISGRSYSN